MQKEGPHPHLDNLGKISAELEKKFKIACIVYFSTIASVLLFALLVNFQKNSPGFQSPLLPPNQVTLLRRIFFGIAFLEFFAIIFLRKVILWRMGFTESGPLVRERGQNGEVHFPAPNFLGVEIVTYAICESIAILGLILFFLGKQFPDFIQFSGISLVYLLIYFPRLIQWRIQAGICVYL